MPPELPARDNLDSDSDCSCARCDAGDEAVQRTLAKAYGACLVIFAAGFVYLVCAISLLAFSNPEKGQSFLVLYALPVASVLGIGMHQAKEKWLGSLQKKP